MSLKYEFVTPLTSLVVVSPDQVSTTLNSFLDNAFKAHIPRTETQVKVFESDIPSHTNQNIGIF